MTAFFYRISPNSSKFFNGYNFTISENVQGDEDVAVDPEMLGKVFENMLAAEERGQSGTFYTPRGIVHFMCVESLSRYLADESGVALEVVKQLAEYETEMPDADLKKLLSKEQTKKLKQALETVKVCDPAVGSGAFPLGMMQVILSVWQAIGQREGESIKRGSLAMSRLKRKIIANNLYGVDIKPEAIEIAKLRMWLSMVVDIPSIDDVEPLPNLDYKLMAGNSLISTIAGEHLIPDPTKTQQGMLNVTPVQAAIQPLLDLQHQYFESHADDRKELSKQIREAEAAMFQAAITDRRQYWQREQRKVEQDVRRMGKASKAQNQKLQTVTSKLRELNSVEIDVARGLRSLDFFQWHLHFNDVFQQKGGFDIVIGNPPYVRIQELTKSSPETASYYRRNYFSATKGNYDIYLVFVERSLNLLNRKGHLGFILPHKFFNANYGQPLREIISKGKHLEKVVYFGDEQVFDGATTYACLLFLNKAGNETAEISEVDNFLDWQFAGKSSNSLISSNRISESEWNFASGKDTDFCERLAERFPIKLKDISKKIFQGLVTSCDSVYLLTPLGDEKNGLIRVRSEATQKEYLLETPVVPPLCKGSRDTHRYVATPSKRVVFPYKSSGSSSASKSLISKEEFLEHYPRTWSYLNENYDRLSDREKGKMRHESWYAYVYPKSISLFKEYKIITPSIASKASYTLDPNGEFYFVGSGGGGGGGYGIILNNDSPPLYKYVLGLLNSKLLDYIHRCVSTPFRGGYYAYNRQYIENLPIFSDLSSEKSQSNYAQIVDLVDKILIQKNVAYDFDTSRLEEEIDSLVYQLYGLTSEEIKIIEGGQD